MSLGQNLAATLFGSTALLVNSIAIQRTEIIIFPAFYIMSLGVIILFVLPFVSTPQAQ